MARVETREGSPLGAEGHGEEHLDEWFARRLESQGIPLRNTAAITSRFLAVVGLAVALMAFLWAVSSVGPAPAKTVTTPKTGTTGPSTSGSDTTPSTGGGNQGGATPISWKDVTVDVLNGYGASGAAATAAAELRAAGWKVGTTANAGTGTTQTYVVYLSGHGKQAKAVSKKLGLGSPVATDQAGVSPSGSSGVAIVLGPDGLPPLA
jgi:hypothetical protein